MVVLWGGGGESIFAQKLVEKMSSNKPPEQQLCTCSFLLGGGAVSSLYLQNSRHIRKTLSEDGLMKLVSPVRSHPIPREEISNHHSLEFRDVGLRWQSSCAFQGTDSHALNLFWSPQEVGQDCRDPELPHLLPGWAVGAVRSESSGGKSRSAL